MHVLVTGGAGYLGSILCETLLDAGHTVCAVDNLLYQQNSLFHLCADKRFEFVSGDVRDVDLMRGLIKTADVVIPLAAVVGAPACSQDPWLARSVNVDAIRLISELRSPDQLIVYPNTNSGYGITSGDAMCTEESPLEPISLYGQTKCEAEILLLDTPNTITLRLATVFGTSPKMRLDLLVNHFLHEAVTSGYIIIFEKDFKRNYVHIRDVADCFVHCIENSNQMVGNPYNLGLDDANFSKEELALKIKEYVPNFYIHFSEIGSDPDQRNYMVSNQRLKTAGFEAGRSIDEGIIELLKSYRMMGRAQYSNV